MWRQCVTAAYDPEALYARFAYNHAHTFSRRIDFPLNPQRASWRSMLIGLGILARVLWKIGVREDYRATFWRMARPALRAGKIEELIHTSVVSYHLIKFTREAVRGVGETSFYAPALPAAPAARTAATV